MTEIQKKKLEIELTKFANTMHDKYNVKLSILVEAIKKKENKPSLFEIEKACITAMHEVYPESISIKSLKSRTRKEFYPLIRQIFAYFAWEYNYSFSASGLHIEKDRTTMIFSQKKISGLVSINDKRCLRIFNIAKQIIKEKYVGTVSKDSK